jgi:hypothetical protein
MNTPVVVKLWLRSHRIEGLFSFLQLVPSLSNQRGVLPELFIAQLTVPSDVISDDLIGLFFLRAYGPKDSGAENQ